MSAPIAEIIAIGDELVSGQRLDTNSQWLSDRLCELGIEPSYHTCVGDSLANGVHVLKTAVARADIIITTGGIGPTKDDLTREVIAKTAEVELEYSQTIEQKIRKIFERHGRQMPENNKLQAYFPIGSSIIPNSEGTAPGIDALIEGTRVFSLPGVPYEMKQMWDDYVQFKIINQIGQARKIKHHLIHCFGAGESQVELLLDGMTDRGAIPRVGITASQATISLRITSFGYSESECDRLIGPTVEKINQRLGELVFGENGIELQDVVVSLLVDTKQTIAIVDHGFGGAVGLALFQADDKSNVLKGATATNSPDLGGVDALTTSAISVREEFGSSIGVAISPAKRNLEQGAILFEISIADGNDAVNHELRYGGHSGLRQSRAVKQVLNQIRLFLLR